MNNMSAYLGGLSSGGSARYLAVTVAGVCLMTLSAKVQVPFWPVPMTLHTLAVFGFAVLLGPRLAVSICLGYLATGAIGLPVFSGTPARGIGFAYMAGPTGGYLAGYLLASGLVGWLASGRGVLGRFFAMALGLVLVFTFGILWLARFVPAEQLMALGVAPFLLGDVLKIAVVAAGAPVLRRGLRHMGVRLP
jgi:biotin transport system substrate-specific component